MIVVIKTTDERTPKMKNLAVLFVLSLGMLLFPRTAVAADPRAQEIVKQARAAIGGEENLHNILSLLAKGQYRRILGDREMAGDRELSILLPDKYLVEDSFSQGGLSTAIVNTRGLNGEKAWNSSS